MAASLVDLKNQMDAAQTPGVTPSDERVYTKIPSPSITVPMGAKVPIRGDDLMAQAAGYNKVSNEEDRFANLYRQSQAIVGQRADSDPEYAKTVMPEFQKAQSQGIEAFANFMIDQADRVKLEYMKKENPEWFTGAEAAKFGFFNSATFGQLTKIMGKAGEVLQGRPYEEVVQEQAERLRLLQKAFPKTFLAGEAASYMMPGSPAKMLFEKSASYGVKALGTLIPKLAANPGLLATVGQSAAAGAAGSAAIGAVTGTLGTDLQGLSLDRGAETALKHGLGGALVGAAVPIAAKAVQVAGRAIAPYAQAVAQKVETGAGRIFGGLSGVSPEALRAYNADAAKLAEAYGSEAKIGGGTDKGAGLVDALKTYRFTQLPETKQANDLLSGMPDTDISPMMKYLNEVKAGLDPKKDAQVDLIKQWQTRIEKHLGIDGGDYSSPIKVNSSNMREVIDDIQESIRSTYGKDAPFAATALKYGARIGRLNIEKMAQSEGGEAGNLYVQLMAKASEKHRVVNFISNSLGSSEDMQAKNAEGFISRLCGGNKTLVQQRMKEVDSILGTDFYQQAQNAGYAREIGSGGSPGWLSQSQTGRSSYAMHIGEAVGGAIGAIHGGLNMAGVGEGAIGSRIGKLAGAFAGSPRTGAMLLGTSDAITGFVQRITESPEALAQIAGQLKAAGAGYNEAIFGAKNTPQATAAMKQLARIRPPMQIQRLASEIYTALIKDGPLSAASMTRVIADTPYFFPLAHYYELADRQMKSKDVQQGMARLQQGASPQIATPRGQ